MRGQKDFQRVKKIGKSWVHTLIVLQIASNSLPYSRVGYVASKHIGNAVKRN
ncbi:MAG TPA: ribonuclease P protein component, partial [Chloroflexi bacterium]|nr:ribonuclease P protein component [Chloroflexota bacterium]